MKATQIIFTVGVLLLAGCKIQDEDKETVVKVNPEFTIDLFEELKDTRNFGFRIKTIEPQACSNNSIDFTSSRAGSLLTLDLSEIVEAPDCVEGTGAVGADAWIGFVPNGTFDVRINLKNTIENEGTLLVTDEAFLLAMDAENGFELLHGELRRIPNKFVWGYVSFQDEEAVGGLPAEFLDELYQVTHEINLPSGYYGYFDINEDARAVLRNPPPYSYFKTFYRQTDGDLEPLESLVEEYRNGTAANLMEVKLFTWNGKTL